jgi:hypothetical protein
MMGLREEVAKAIHESNRIVPWEQTCQQDLAYERADAAIKAVLEALKEPTPRMISEGESAASVGIGKPADDEAITRVWREMLTAFTREHYLSALAEGDGR